MMSSSDEKRLAKFLQPEKSAKKRLGYALDYIRNTSRFNESRFMNDQYESLLDVLLSTIKQYDEEHEPSDQKKILGMLRSTANIKKAFTHKGHDDKYLGIMELLDRIVLHLPHKMTSDSFVSSLVEILLIFLHPDNVITYKLPAFEVLLRCVQQMDNYESPHVITALVVECIPISVKPQSPVAMYVNRAAVSNNNQTNQPPICWGQSVGAFSMSDKEQPLSPDIEIVKFLEVLFRVSIYGFNTYDGNVISRGDDISPMDQVNHFIFWRDFIYTHFARFFVGRNVVEMCSGLVCELDAKLIKHSCLPPSPRVLLFTVPPISIQKCVYDWLSDAMGSKVLVDHIWCGEGVYYMLVLCQQRFHPELMRKQDGITLVQSTIRLYEKCLMSTDTSKLNSLSLQESVSLSKRPCHFGQNMDFYLSHMIHHISLCFLRIDEVDCSVNIVNQMVQTIKEGLQFYRLLLKSCTSEYPASVIRGKMQEVCCHYMGNTSRQGVIAATLSDVVEVTLSSFLLAPNWKNEDLHSEFSLKMYNWLIDEDVIHSSIGKNGVYAHYALPGDTDTPDPSNFKVSLLSLWGNLLFTACSSCWLYLDVFRHICLKANPEYMHLEVSCRQLLENAKNTPEESMSQLNSEETKLPAPQQHTFNSASQIWSSVAEQHIDLLSINSLYESVIAIDRILTLIPLSTLSVLHPKLNALVISCLSDIAIYCCTRVVVKHRHYEALEPLSNNKTERTLQKQAIKSNAKLQEYEKNSPLGDISPDTVMSFVFPFLLVEAQDVRKLFINSRLLAMEALCIVLQTNSKRLLCEDMSERCLGLIYQSLLNQGYSKLLAVVFMSCPDFFSLGLPGTTLFVEPFVAGIEKIFANTQWASSGGTFRGSILEHLTSKNVVGKYTAGNVKEVVMQPNTAKMSIDVIYGCLDLLFGIVSYIHRYPDIAGSTSSDKCGDHTEHRAHYMEIALRIGEYGQPLKCFLTRIVDLIDRHIWLVKDYKLKNKFIQLFIHILCLQMYPFQSDSMEATLLTDSNLEEKETESDLDPLSSTLSTSSISCSTKSINKLVLDRICAYVADSDKEFALCSIEGLTLLNEIFGNGPPYDVLGRKIVEALSSVVRITMIEVIHSCIEKSHPNLPKLTGSRSQPVTLSERADRIIDDDIAHASNECHVDMQSMRRNVAVIKAGLNCLSRWILTHPQVLDNSVTRELFVDCYEACAIGEFLKQLSNSKSIQHLSRVLNSAATGDTLESENRSTTFHTPLNFYEQEEKLMAVVQDNDLPKLLRKDVGAYTLSDMLNLMSRGNDAEIQDINEHADIHMRHIVNYYNLFPTNPKGSSIVDSMFATEFYGLSSAALSEFLRGNNAGNESNIDRQNIRIPDECNCSDTQIEPSGDHNVGVIKDDYGNDILTNDEIEKLNPVHVAFRDELIITLVNGRDGVSRIICRDMLGAHVWAGVPLTPTQDEITTDMILSRRKGCKERRHFVEHLSHTDPTLSKESLFLEENPLLSSQKIDNVQPGQIHTSRSTSNMETYRRIRTSQTTQQHDPGRVEGLRSLLNETHGGIERSGTVKRKSAPESISSTCEKSVDISNVLDSRSCIGDLQDIDIHRDLLSEILDQLPLEEFEDSSMLGGDTTLLKYQHMSNTAGSQWDGDISERETISTLRQDFTSTKYLELENWLGKMLDDGHLWIKFINFLKLEYSEESGCFLHDVHNLQNLCKKARNHPLEPSISCDDLKATATDRMTLTELLEHINSTAEHILRKYFSKGGQHEINISDTNCREVTSLFERSEFVCDSELVVKDSEDTCTSGFRIRDLRFFSTVFNCAFRDVATMLVRDKLTRFLNSLGEKYTILTDLESIEMEAKQSSQELEKALATMTPPPACCQPSSNRVCTLKDGARLLAVHLGLLPDILSDVYASLEEDTSLRLFQHHSSFSDYRILCGSNNPLARHLSPSLNKTSRQIIQELRHIDELPTREQFKIAVLYVGCGQFTQKEILANESGSSEYELFLKSLGDEVDLATHRGFNGRLDSKRYTNGRSFPYYADDHVEVFFHVSTRMPTVPDDDQQIGKKRHIGNDYVHIIWTEDTRDYSPTTITSDFGDVIIVIKPHAAYERKSCMSEYCSIKLYTKQDLGDNIGPLCNGMLVPMRLLGPLVRTTAVQANRAVNIMHRKSYEKPYVVRQRSIAEVISTCGTPFSYDLLLNLLAQNSD
mmetsp:Transcript_26443/g.39252  ORF Transcript_26443/g.39252 Transcript_26443/m.39252 type:complete len:2189 (-) Transcript_26443:344-6910(-)